MMASDDPVELARLRAEQLLALNPRHVAYVAPARGGAVQLIALKPLAVGTKLYLEADASPVGAMSEAQLEQLAQDHGANSDEVARVARIVRSILKIPSGAH